MPCANGVFATIAAYSEGSKCCYPGRTAIVYGASVDATAPLAIEQHLHAVKHGPRHVTVEELSELALPAAYLPLSGIVRPHT